MFRLLLITLLASSCSALMYAQSEMPADLTIKLDEKAKKLFPDDLRKQDRWLRDQNDGWIRLTYFEAPKDNEANFAAIKKAADAKFDLDFYAKADFIQKSLDALTTIDSYATYFPKKEQFLQLKQIALKSNSDDYTKAAKFFEQQSQAVIEIGSIPVPESADEDLWMAVKLAAANKFPNDYPKQKEYVEKCAKRFEALYAYEESRKMQAKVENVKDVSLFDKLNELKAKMEKSVLLLKSPNSGVAYKTKVHDKDVVIFPFSSYSANEMSISTLADDRINFGEVFVAKEAPVAIAIINNAPEGIAEIEIAPEASLKEAIGKEEYIFSQEQRSANLQRVKIMSISNGNVNLANRISSSIPQGSVLLSIENSAAMGFVIKSPEYGQVSDFSNKENSRYVIRNINKERVVSKMIRIDNLANWEKVDTTLYSKQAEELNALIKSNLEFISFFTVRNLADLDSTELLREISEKYKEIFSQRVDNSSRNKQLRDMVYDVMAKMKSDLRNYSTNSASIYSSMRDEFQYNLDVRKKMIESLEKAVRSNGYLMYDFDDIRPKR